MHTATPDVLAFDFPAVVRTCEEVWSGMRERHPDVPVIFSGIQGRSASAPLRWCAPSFLLFADEGFQLWSAGSGAVLDAILHEATHALAWARKIEDASRDGRYHNARFARLAQELGLEVTPGPHGFASTTRSQATEDAYQPELAMLGLVLAECAPNALPRDPSPPRHLPLFACGCERPRKLRAGAAVMALGPVTCGLCGRAFAPSPPPSR